MKTRTKPKTRKPESASKPRRIQFEAPPEMLDAIERVKAECAAVGMKMTDSMLVRICVANWMIKQGWIKNSAFAKTNATVNLP